MPREVGTANISYCICRAAILVAKTTSPEIETPITDIVSAYRNELEIEPDKYEDAPVTTALIEQLTIGMYPFLCDFVSKQWAEFQQTHITKKASWWCRKNGQHSCV